MRLEEVQSDDIPAAVAFARQSMVDGTWSEEVAEILLNRQSDMRALLDELQHLAVDARSQRTNVRRALGDAAHALSDEDIDRIIQAAGGSGVTPPPPQPQPEQVDEAEEQPIVGEDERLDDDGDDLDDDFLDDLAAEDELEDDEWDIDDDAEPVPLPDRRDDEDDWRHDRITAAEIAKGGGAGKGYNPYRDKDGKFGSGARKKPPTKGKAAGSGAAAKPTAPRTVKAKAAPKPKAPKFDATPHKAKIDALKRTEAGHRKESLAIADQMRTVKAQAAALPAKQRGALKTKHAELSALRKQHQAAATSARTERIAESKAMTAARKEHTAKAKTAREAARKLPAPTVSAPPPKPAPAPPPAVTPVAPTTPIRGALPKTRDVAALVANDQNLARFGANGSVSRNLPDPDNIKHEYQFTPEAQRAMRDHANKVLGMYGLHDKDAGLIGSNNVEIRTDDAMDNGYTNGLHWGHNGHIAISIQTARNLHEYSRLSPDERNGLGEKFRQFDRDTENKLTSYNTMIHEATHGHGGSLIRTHPHTMVEELTTEMVSRKVVADAHGLQVHELRRIGSYGNYIDSTARALMDASGRGLPEVHEAMAGVAVAAKRMNSRNLSATDMQRWLAGQLTEKLGAASRADLVYEVMMQIAERDP